MHGASHLLASCSAVLVERRYFLSKIRRSWSDSLSAAADTDWSTSILSADIHLDDLNAATDCVSEIVAKLRLPAYKRKKEYLKALKHHRISLEINQEVNNVSSVSICFYNIGEINLLLNKLINCLITEMIS